MKLPSINPVERALIAQQWHETTITARIHALMGEDGDRLAGEAGRVFYVVLGAARADDLDPDMPELRILRGAVNAVYDQVGDKSIPAMRRESILQGLEVAAQLIPLFERKTLNDSACELALKLRSEHVRFSDFESVMGVRA